MIHLNETINAIKAAGKSKVRIVPMQGHEFDTGLYSIEILKDGWSPIINGIPKIAAESLVTEAFNNLLCG